MKHIQFPKKFILGAATNALQVEGQPASISSWENYISLDTSKSPNRLRIGANHFLRYKEDIAELRKINAKHYRFSVSWSRIMPDGKTLNAKGLAFYQNLVAELLKNGITPWITLYAYDMPATIQDEGGWINRNTVKQFTAFTSLIANTFKSQIKNWITLEDPASELEFGYRVGSYSPGIQISEQIYVAAHNMLLAHARSLEQIKEKIPDSLVGFSSSLNPVRFSGLMTKRVKRMALSHIQKLFFDPVLKGRYPIEIEDRIFYQNGDNLRPTDLEAISRPIDFLAILHNGWTTIKREYFSDFLRYSIIQAGRKHHPPIIDSKSILEALHFIKNTYDNPELIIAGCGITLSPEDENGLRDHVRAFFYRQYLAAVHSAIEEGCNIRGFFAHSLLDGFEFSCDDTLRSGLFHVDFSTFDRTPKQSAKWYKDLCENNGFVL